MCDMQKLLSQLQSHSKQLEGLYKQMDKDEKIQRNKMKKAVEQGDIRRAEMYTKLAAICESEPTTYLRLSTEIKDLASEVENALKAREVVEDAMDSATATTTPMTQVDSSMQQIAEAKSIPTGSLPAVDGSLLEKGALSCRLVQDSCFESEETAEKVSSSEIKTGSNEAMTTGKRRKIAK